MSTPVERPNPLREVANKVGTAWSAVAAVVGAATSFGLLTSAQAEALAATGEALPGIVLALGTIAGALIPLAGGIVASFSTVKVAKDHVTPVSDPRDNEGNKLTPDVVAPVAGPEVAPEAPAADSPYVRPAGC
jgi:hypothetical protein